MSENEVPQDYDAIEQEAWHADSLESPSTSEISTAELVPDSAPDPVPDPAIWESLTPKENDNDGRLPDNVKIAGALFIVHGACLALNSFVWRDPAMENNLNSDDLLRGLLWFGATFFIANGLFERRIWAWWAATLIGGSIGIVNLLASIGNVVSRSVLHSEEAIQVNFFPPVIAIAAAAMLISIALLLTSSAKAAFGITKDNPSGLF